MSLESFFGLEDSDSQGSAEASEAFKEQMRKNAKVIKTMAKTQKKLKKDEDKLAALLIAYIKDPAKQDIVFLIVRLLQENVPGPFILAILSIGDPQLERDLILLLNPKQLEGEKKPQQLITFSDQALSGQDPLPQSVKDKLNSWGTLILRSGSFAPTRTLQSVLTPDQKLKSLVLNLIEYSLDGFFKRHGLNLDSSRNRQFALLSIQSVLIQLRDLSGAMSDVERFETDSTQQ
jgi:hypothetical protein